MEYELARFDEVSQISESQCEEEEQEQEQEQEGQEEEQEEEQEGQEVHLLRQISHISDSQHEQEQEEEQEEQEEEQDDESKPPLTRLQIFTIVSLCFTTVCSSLFISLLAPFFATEAAAKGASNTEIGLVFGIYQAIIFIMSPVYGRFLTKIGPKFMYVCGIFVTSSCAILFGTLEWCPNGKIYVGMCFLVRSCEALSAAAMMTASLAITAHTFPKRLSTVMGILEGCYSVGLMLGPPVGGLLFSVSGFHLPFFVSGGLLMCGGLLSFILLPSLKLTAKEKKHTGLGLLKIPLILMVGYMVTIGNGTIGFIDVGLATHFDKFHLSEAIIGLIFLVTPVFVLIFAPLNGFINDKNKTHGRYIILIGCVVGAIGAMGLGPSPILAFLPSDQLWVLVVSMAIAGMGMSSLVVTYQEFITAAAEYGYVNNLETQGMISGLYNSFQALGAFLGPTTAGFLLEHLGFDWSATVFGFGILLAGIIIGSYTLFTRGCKKKDPELDILVNDPV